MELLCAVLVSLRNSFVDSLSEERLLEWRGVVQDLLEAKFSLSFFVLSLAPIGSHAISEAILQEHRC